MSSHGALDSETNIYVLPSNALKGREYVCADCNQRVILRKGTVRIHHFAHFTPTTKCKFYEHSGESETHKHAKLLMMKWLNEKRSISFSWQCQKQTPFGTCGTSDGYTDFEIEYKEGDQVELEYRCPIKKYIADVAVLNNGKVRYIIEIKHSHSTTTTVRPEPWFEVDANDISEGNHYGEETIYLPNCRIYEKRYCANCRVKEQAWVSTIPPLTKKYGIERQWRQDIPCLLCKRMQYNPEWIQGTPRQVCKICLGCEPDKLRELCMKSIWDD
jgi:hypothetical protein